jgi:ribosomal protein S18 acetylase RimI-like enzyme
VRPARARDRDAVARLLDLAEALHADLQPAFFAPPRGTRRLFPVEESEQLLVAEEGGAIAGLARVLVRSSRALLDELIVDPAQRRRGCGRALVGAAARFAREHGAHKLVLTVWEGNDEAARFYAALGYRRISQVLGTEL